MTAPTNTIVAGCVRLPESCAKDSTNATKDYPAVVADVRILWKADPMSDCAVQDCGRPRYGRGYCRAHHARVLRHGDPKAGIPVGKTLRIDPPPAARFASRFREDAEGCWVWLGALKDNGYGTFSDGGVNHYAHRYSLLMRGEVIGEGMVVDHKCRNRACVNPEHLQIVTPRENAENLDNIGTGRSGVRGVAWHEDTQSWAVYVVADYKRHFGGRFPTVGEAEVVAIALRDRLHTNNLLDHTEGETP